MYRERFVACVAIILAVGCGPSGEFVPLTGTVTLDEKPIEAGAITFHNQSGGPSGYGNVQSDGTYIAKTGSQKGLKPGLYKISIIAQERPEKVNRIKPEKRKVLSPTNYSNPSTSGLEYTLTDSGGKYDIVLKSSSPQYTNR